ncbi:hypothetical protein OO184_15270 [Photorhabdus sp. APURE]|uniref:hypothetical protein n=1 Tax=Photorhabdus aballayi TaxID=2991723 RepID=UPI00223CF852|nr:hypothetical protein [Photorhabdus aballayi]MCW7549253.1 hypothetical protein [Photorhabdus aballayi]
MNLSKLVDHATDKERFHTVEDYIDFCSRYLEYVDTGLQARIVSQNERHYLFFQYKQDGNFNITRPLNSRLIYDAVGFAQQFRLTLEQLRDMGNSHLATYAKTLSHHLYTSTISWYRFGWPACW